ncbi:alpha/beta fold hydrolase [Saccharothrix deserti]|uniref:alpha/beta fold hydrolase n=1 Tax=Saccharothrix deserti TaxID=2593674 RepID=UPI00131B8F8D|nr:alpha/beta hydrolase [Saccharothrix deserti]
MEVQQAVVLVHGWGASAAAWDAHLPLLAGRHAIVLDLPGHGVTPGCRAGADIPGIVDGLAAVIAASAGTPAVVVGHSMGGQIAVRLAVDHPELVRAVAVIDPAYGADDDELAGCADRLADLERRGSEAGAEFVDAAFDGGSGDSALWRDARRQMSATSGTVLARLYRSMYLDDGAIGGRQAAAEYLSRLPVPLLSLYSTQYAAHWAESLPLPPGSRVVTWLGLSHYLHQERPAAFCDLLLDWLSTL